jgi:rSAM/selenodomain-associated transferase 1
MMKSALIIFVRKPELGKVKTRLAAEIGEEEALKVYVKLLEHTRQIASRTEVGHFVFEAGESSGDFWKHFARQEQQGADLGTRMKNAFTLVFEKGYEKAVIIGSDCLELTSDCLNRAFLFLDDADVVVGPANDGGYYLLGMKKLYVELFEGKQWSTEHVFAATIRNIEQLGLTYKLLKVLNDVDEKKDVPADWLAGI